jgi:YD repeat-containing protein
MADEPTNTELLEEDANGGLVIAQLQADGTTQRRPVTAAEALAFLDRLVAAYGADSVPQGALAPGGGEVIDRTLTPAELVDRIAYLVDRLRAETGGNDAATITALNAAVRHPRTIQAIAADAGSARATLLAVWPDLDRILAWRPTEDPEGVPGGTGTDTSLAEAGGGTGVAGPLPPPGIEADPVAGYVQGPPAGGSASATDAARAGDPVLPFSGQLLIEAVDFELEGVGLDVRFARTYLHATAYNGPLGPSWDHSYNLWLRERLEQNADGTWSFAVYRSTGSLGEQRFVADEQFDAAVDPTGVADAILNAADGNHDRLVKAGGNYRLETPGGLQIDYSTELRAERLRDRNGNEIRLVWEGEPLRLTRLVDTCGRVVRFGYDDRGLLIRLRDEALGRELRYTYDVDGRLERVMRTVAPDRPLQLVQAFRRWDEDAPLGLRDNIVAILDGRGREVLQLRYGDEPGLVSYNRVVEQRDGGVTRYEYGFVAEPDPDAPDDPRAGGVLRVWMTLPDGPVHVLDYNPLGRLVRLELLAVDEGGARRFETRWRYNEDGRLTLERRPDGSAVEYVYGRALFVAAGGDPDAATPEERARFGELRSVIEYSRPGLAGPSRRITEFDYDPRFALLSERRGPFYADVLGNRVGSGPAFSQRVEYDARGNVVVLRHPDCTRPDGSVQTGLDLRLEHDTRGRVTRREIVLEDGTTLATTYSYPLAGDPRAAHPIREVRDADGLALVVEFVHDAGGRLLRARDPTGLVDERVYDDAGRLERVDESGPDVAPRRVITEWAPHDVPARVIRSRAGADGGVQSGAELTETFAFDADGDVCESVVRSADGVINKTVRFERDRARRIVCIEEDGVRARSFYDARGLVVRREISAPGVPTQTWRQRYDAVGRLVGLTDPAGDEETLMLDGFGRVAERRLANGSSVFMEWDAADRLVRTRVEGRHPDVPGRILLHEERLAYDEGGRLQREETAAFDPVRRAGGAGAVRWARRTYAYDRADRLVEIAGPGPIRQRLEYDGLGRITRAVDDTGTLSVSVYDDAANTTQQELIVSGDGPSGPTTMRLRSFERFDARGHAVLTRDGLGNEIRRSFDSDGNLVATVDAAGVSHETEVEADGAISAVRLAVGTADECAWSYHRDAQRQVIAVDGPAGRLLDVDRDSVGRVARLRPAGGGGASFSYDVAGRLVESREPSGIVTRTGYAPGGLVNRRWVDVSARVPPTARDAVPDLDVRFEHDGLSRLVLADDGHVPVTRRYDSRGLLVSEATATREVSWEYSLSGAARAFRFSDGRRIAFRRAANGLLRRVVDVGADGAGGAGEEVARIWPLGAGVVSDVRWRGAVARRERRDGAGRLLSIEATRVAGGAVIAGIEQLADARGLPILRRFTVGAASELSLLDTDPVARVVRETRVPTGAAALGVAAFDAAGPIRRAQADVDVAIAQARAAVPIPAPEEIVLTFDADGTRRQRTARAGGAVVATTTYSRTPGGLAVAQGLTRTQDADGLPTRAAGAQLTYDAYGRIASGDIGGASVTRVQRDALGRPWRIVGPAGDVELVHDGERAVEAHISGGNVVRTVRAPGSRLVLELQDGARRLHPLSDPDGTTHALLDSTAAVLATSGWDPWGERRAATGSWPGLSEAFHGMPPLVGTLLLAPVRTYDAMCGGYLEADRAVMADGPNFHAFARGNPLAFTDPLGFMAQRGSATGRGSPDGVFYGHGTRRVDSFLTRVLATVGGSLWNVWGMITEPLKQVYDFAGTFGGFLGAATGLWDYEHRCASGIGQLAERGNGTLDIVRAVGRQIAGTPGRAWDAAERGDYAGFGAEALNFYMIGRPIALPAARYGGNWGVYALGALGETGQAWRRGIRMWQIRRLAAQVTEIRGPAHQTINYSYHASRATVRFGQTYARAGKTTAISISERAFTPGLRDLFLGLSEVGGVAGQGGFFARLRYVIDNGLRGNLALRSMLHERWHAEQFRINPSMYETFASWPEELYSRNPLEWTQPDYPNVPFVGAFNSELSAPYPWVENAVVSGQFTLLGAEAGQRR